MLKKTEKTSLCTFPSTGNSPVRKWIEGVGAVILSFSMDFRVFLWKIESGSKWEDLRANEESPELVIGQVNVF